MSKNPNRLNISSGSPWEDKVGYSRAVRVGNLVEVAGTTAMDGDQVVGKGDEYEQAKFIFKKIEISLNKAGATFQDVVRTRMYVTDLSRWEAVGRAHGEVFGTIKPAATMVGVKGLINPDLLVEIEVTAVLRSMNAD